MKITIAVIALLISSTFLFTESFAQSLDLPNDVGTIVYELAGKFYLRDLQNIITSSESPDVIIKAALARGGDIYIAQGTYDLTKDFAGFDIKYGTHLKLASDAYIIVPSGYNGYVFRFNSGTGQSVLEGGSIYENKPVQRNWIGILMQGGKNGVYFNLVQNIVITYPHIVIDFNAAAGQWINANTFVNIKGIDFVRGIEFDFKGKNTPGADGFDGNTFRDLQFQSGPMTTYGINDIKHRFNAFYNVQFWDLPASAISSTINQLAVNTIIIGGQMTYQGFVDEGTNTLVLDSRHNSISSNSTLTSEIIKGTYQPKVSIPTVPSGQVLSMSMPQQQTTGFVKGNQAQLTVSLHPVDINISGKISDSKGGSAILYVTRPDGNVEQNQAYVTSDGTFYFPMIFDRNSLTGQYKIKGLYHNSDLGTLFISVTSDQTLPIETSSNQNMVMIPPSDSNATLFASIKSSAKLWSDGKISDNIFVESIQNLVSEGIIQNNEGKTSSDQSSYIPTWLKNNARWLADGQISNSDFISNIQYLLKNGIIQIPSQQKNS